MSIKIAQEPKGVETQVRHLIDTDIHVYPKSEDEVREYLAEPWRSRSFGPSGRPAYNAPGGNRLDSMPPNGGPPGSDPDFLWKQVFAAPRVEVHYGVLIEIQRGFQLDARRNTAYRSAVNEWMAATWLGKYNAHGRYKGSISVAPNDPKGAAAEIEKWAGHPHFVQVVMPPWVGNEPFGHPMYDPIWEAASRHNLPVGTHVNSAGPFSWVTPVGFARYWSENHAVRYPLTYAAHLTSLICDGVFERFDKLRFVFIEGGFHWAAPVIERILATAKYLGSELNVRNLPTRELIYEHLRFTSQPHEDAPTSAELIRSLEVSDASRMLMFSSDYPHWDGDDPWRTLPRLSPELEERIYLKNASELYRLPVTLPVSKESVGKAR